MRHQVWAAPLTFGPWAVIATHLNSVKFKIEVNQIGDIPTLITGEVLYWNIDNQKITTSFIGSITIETGNSIGNVEIRLQGTPTGSSCWVDVSS